jgi:hypothetical protein
MPQAGISRMSRRFIYFEEREPIGISKWGCQNCGQSGPAHLSQPEGRVYDFSVEAVPAGFKVARTEYGETFCCTKQGTKAPVKTLQAQDRRSPLTTRRISRDSHRFLLQGPLF